MWYVIQVINGREDVMRERIERMVPAGAMQELFYPQFQTEIKVHGEWVNTTKPLFPGYLICDTADPRTVQQLLLRMDDFAQVLSQDGQFVPLAKEEVQLIGSFTHVGDRVVPMSEALKDGDQVVVTAGPLLGHEGLIKTINRRKSTAYLELALALPCFQPSSARCETLKRRSPNYGRMFNGTGRIPEVGDVGLKEQLTSKSDNSAALHTSLHALEKPYCRASPAKGRITIQDDIITTSAQPDVHVDICEDGREGAATFIRSQSIPAPGTPEFADLCRSLDNRPVSYRALKRIFDIIFSGLVCFLGLVPCTVLAVAITLDTKGSPIYSQERVGRLGRPFRIYKFRSMVADADDVEKYFTPEQLATWRRERKVDDDPRITRLGRLIRKTSLDEIPQFLNVLLGQISIVGPRVITIDEVQNYAPEDRAVLLSVPQGITGAWQCGPRNLATFENGLRQKIELAYARDANVKTDIDVFFETFKVMLVRRTGK